MRIKTKITLANGALFGAILGVVAISLYYLHDLKQEAENILKDNHESVVYCQAILRSADSLSVDSLAAFARIEHNLQLQEQNITEPGEQELTIELRTGYEKLRDRGFSEAELAAVRNTCLAIQDLNLKAIIRKSEDTRSTAERASTYLVIICTIVSILAFTFIVNFPGYVANPIVLLTNSIKSISRKNYEERLHFDRKDEFSELSEAFNLMAEKLDEYEHSNLAMILSEKKRIEAIINRMSDPIIGLDEKQRVVFANDQALSLLNLEPAHLVGRYAPDVALDNDLLRTLIREGTDNNHESALIKIVVNGKENYFSKENIAVNYTPTGEKKSTAIGRVIMLKNITPYKELDLAKTNFIATISHELKTPIASLQTGIKLLTDDRVGNLNPEQRNIIDNLSSETTRLSKITHELLDLAQVETGNIKLDMRKINPADIVQYALESVKFQAERKHVTLDVETGDDLPEVKADLDKTTWVLINLLTNAIRYSPENDKVVLQCFPVNRHVKFAVIDHGPGIESKYFSRLFEKFFQVPGTATGTGLGLAISKEFIEAQHGSIEVQSSPGKGSTFSFMLESASS